MCLDGVIGNPGCEGDAVQTDECIQGVNDCVFE